MNGVHTRRAIVAMESGDSNSNRGGSPVVEGLDAPPLTTTLENLPSNDATPPQEEEFIPGPSPSQHRRTLTTMTDELNLSLTEHHVRGNGILASRTDLNLSPEEFATGCRLLQLAALGDQAGMQELIHRQPNLINFRDYDRRTALHVAASEGHSKICKYLIEVNKAMGGNTNMINRSDRWGGSPLDDAHRHQHSAVVHLLRMHGATTGSANRSTNLIHAAAAGDMDEVKNVLLYASSPQERVKLIDHGDYDLRTALHLAAGEGHTDVVRYLCETGANVNAEDRFGGRPLNDALRSNHAECVKVLREFGALKGKIKSEGVASDNLDESKHVEYDNLQVDFGALEMIERIGSGAFGEIYKCKWRGTLVAAKCIKSAKIRQEWVAKQALKDIDQGGDVDDAMRMMDEAEQPQEDIEKETALEDFRQEIKVLKNLRHPHIVLLLAYSTTKNFEVMISELMKCSLLDVFKAHIVHGSRMPKRTQIVYAAQLAQGMNYLHTCKPPVIHRDLKPANLLIDNSGVLKVSDFGLAKLRPDPESGKESQAYVMTGETGSYRFMAPEVYRHESYNETVDVYSFAMILFYLLDGRPPWPNLSGVNAVRKAAEEGDRPQVPRFWSIRMQNLLQSCWDEDPRSRPRFDGILVELSEYARDQFHEDFDVAVPAATDTKSCCTIL